MVYTDAAEPMLSSSAALKTKYNVKDKVEFLIKRQHVQVELFTTQVKIAVFVYILAMLALMNTFFI